MKFRDYDVDKVIILESKFRFGLENAIEKVAEDYNLIDLQFSVDKGKFFALALVNNKPKKEQLLG